MSVRRQVWQTLSDLLARLEKDVTTIRSAAAPERLERLNLEVRKLGREQFKANVLAEKQADQWQEALAAVRETQAQHTQLLDTLSAEQAAAARYDLLQAIIPALDGLESALASGREYLAQPEEPDPPSTGAGHRSERDVLAAWLDGLRFVRERLLAVLEAGGVTPIPTVGQPFDPYVHVAIDTTPEGEGTPGTIVAEERRGYRSPAGVLRFAEVIVYQPAQEDAQHDRWH
jgi:molecular chaperone GrpE (heat shock protein)